MDNVRNTTSAAHQNILRRLGWQCQKYRIERGYTQKDVAADVGMHPSAISRFENGRANTLIIYQWYLDKGFTYDPIGG